MDLYSRYGQSRLGRQVVLRSLWLSKLSRQVTVTRGHMQAVGDTQAKKMTVS